MNIPESLQNVDVVVALAIPLPTQQGGLNFPLLEGQITATYDTSFLLRTAKGEDMLLPYSRIQHIMKAPSKLSVAGGIVIPGR